MNYFLIEEYDDHSEGYLVVIQSRKLISEAKFKTLALYEFIDQCISEELLVAAEIERKPGHRYYLLQEAT